MAHVRDRGRPKPGGHRGEPVLLQQRVEPGHHPVLLPRAGVAGLQRGRLPNREGAGLRHGGGVLRPGQGDPLPAGDRGGGQLRLLHPGQRNLTGGGGESPGAACPKWCGPVDRRGRGTAEPGGEFGPVPPSPVPGQPGLLLLPAVRPGRGVPRHPAEHRGGCQRRVHSGGDD